MQDKMVARPSSRAVSSFFTAHPPYIISCLLLCSIAIQGCCTTDADCDDGDFCNGQETCNGLICENGPAPSCDDGIDCTVDFCDVLNNDCNRTMDDSICQDGLWCNGSEYCSAALGCQPGTPIECDDAVTCTVDSCDESSDSCLFTADDSLCGDGVFCNGDEVCDTSSGCVPGSPRDCTDSHACTTESCDPILDACVYETDDSLCDDLLWCTLDVCDESLGCLNEPVTCDDGFACTTDSCDEDSDSCSHEPSDPFCDSSSGECTEGRCEPLSLDADLEGCVLVPEPDGTPCFTLDICIDGTCVARTGCGDGYVEPLDSSETWGPEECDDGNTTDGDSCEACSSIDFQVNTSEDWAEQNPDVAVWTYDYFAGNFIIVFEQESYETPDWTDVRFRRYDNVGNALDTSDRLLTTDTAGIEMQPRVVALLDGGFAAVWAENPSDGDLFGIQLGIYDDDGNELDIVQVNTSTFGSQTEPFIALSPDGTQLLVLWEDDSPSGGAFASIAMRRFSTTGIPIDTDQISIPTGSYFFASEPRAAFASDGRFMVTWTHSETGSQTDVLARLFSSSASPLTDPISMLDILIDRHEYSPSLTWDEASAYFVVTWEQITGTGSTEIAATILDPDDLSTVPDPLVISPVATTEEYFEPVVSGAQILASHHPIPETGDPLEQNIVVFAYSGTPLSGLHTDLPYDVFVHRWIVDSSSSPPLEVFDGADPTVLSTTTSSDQGDLAMLLVSTGARPSGTVDSGSLVGAWTDFSREGGDVDYSAIRARHLPVGWMVP